MKENAFPKKHRIAKGNDFTIVLRRGGCAADECLVVFAFPRRAGRGKMGGADAVDDSGNATRLGVTIPKKTGNAVVRNRWKRLIREAFRTQKADIPMGYDIVVRPKKGAVGSTALIRRGLPRLAKKAIERIQPAKS